MEVSPCAIGAFIILAAVPGTVIAFFAIGALYDLVACLIMLANDGLRSVAVRLGREWGNFIPRQAYAVMLTILIIVGIGVVTTPLLRRIDVTIVPCGGENQTAAVAHPLQLADLNPLDPCGCGE